MRLVIAFTGLAGILWVPLNGLTTPDVLYWPFSGEIVFMTLLGGFRNFSGPIVGGIAFTFIKTYAVASTEYWQLLLGAVLGLLCALCSVSRWRIVSIGAQSYVECIRNTPLLNSLQKLQTTIFDGGANPFTALFDGAVRQVHEGKKADEHTLAPVYPNQGFKTGVVMQVVNYNGYVDDQQRPERPAAKRTFHFHHLKV